MKGLIADQARVVATARAAKAKLYSDNVKVEVTDAMNNTLQVAGSLTSKRLGVKLRGWRAHAGKDFNGAWAKHRQRVALGKLRKARFVIL